MEDVDRAIAFCTSIDPEFPARIQGAPAEWIEQGEAACGRPYSPEHRRFLERMGGSEPGATAWLEFRPRYVDARTLLYSHQRTEGPMPEGFELIGIDESESQLDLYLVDRPEEGRCLELINSRDGCSYANLPGDTAPRRTLAPGLTVYICMQALRLRVWPQRLMRAVFVPPASAPILPQLAEFHRLALGEGYQPFWFAPDPGDTVVVAAREETVVIAQQTPPGGLVVSVAANSVADFSQFAGVLMDDLGLRRA